MYICLDFFPRYGYGVRVTGQGTWLLLRVSARVRVRVRIAPLLVKGVWKLVVIFVL